MLTLELLPPTIGGYEWLVIIVIVIVIALLISTDKHGGKELIYRPSFIEDNIRRCKSLIVEHNLGQEFELALDLCRKEISDMYTMVRKRTKEIDIAIANLDESVNELLKAIESKNRDRIRVQLSLLKDRVADLRSEIRRRGW